MNKNEKAVKSKDRCKGDINGEKDREKEEEYNRI